MITKVIIQNVFLLWLKLEQAKFELFSQKVIGKLLDNNVVIMWL